MSKRFHITLGFFAFLCVLGWFDLHICVYFLAGLTFHELGHVLAMLCCRIKICSFSLRVTGAIIRHQLCSYRQELLCAAAGPAASFLLAYVMCRSCPPLSILSTILGAINLLPIIPLDGGRILRSILVLWLEEELVYRWMVRMAFVVCCALMIAACCITAFLQAGIWPIFAALVLLWKVGCAEQSEK